MKTESQPTPLVLAPVGGARRASTGRAYTLDLAPLRVDVLQIEDVCFGTDREIFLPVDPTSFDEEPEATQARGALAGLDAIRACLQFASVHPAKQLLVVGHTDTTGSDSHNLKLSQRRAQSVALYLRGEREAWAHHAAENDEIADIQVALKWISRVEGWPTDPGPLDGRWGDLTREARRNFRRFANEALSLSLDLDAKQSAADWEAIFQTYDRELSRTLRRDAAGLRQLRSTLYFVDEGTLGCGEHWPVTSLGIDDLADAANRRVEFLWFDADELVDRGGDVPGAKIYGEGRYRFEPVPADPTDPSQALIYQVRAVLLDHFHTERIARRPYRLCGPLPALIHERHGETDLNGRLQEDELPAGDYYLEVDEAGIVVGTHFEFAQDEPDDIYRIAVPAKGDIPEAPQPYNDPWMLFAEDDDEDDFAKVGVDPYEPDDPELDAELVEVDEDDPDAPELDAEPDAHAA